jgi:preprotein translocase subunit SecG
MLTFFIVLATVILVLTSLFLVMIVLMQRSSSNSGMGAAIGGGAAESAFGTGTENTLARGTVIGAVVFFVTAFGLYLAYLHQENSQHSSLVLPEFAAEEIIPAPESTQEHQ